MSFLIKFLVMAAVLVGGFLLTWLITIPIENRRLIRAHQRFHSGRRKVSDEQFLLDAAAPPPLGNFFLQARRAMAELCGMHPLYVHAHDSMRTLLDLQHDGGYLTDFVMYTEERTITRIDCDRAPIDDKLSFAEYVTQLAHCVNGTID